MHEHEHEHEHEQHEHEPRHDVDALQPASPALRRALAIAIGAIALLTLIAVAALWPRSFTPPASGNDLVATENVDGTVTKVATKECGSSRCAAVAVHLDAGTDAGRTVDLPDMAISDARAPLQVGDQIVVARVTVLATGQTVFNYNDHQRSRPLWILTLLFAAIVVAIARWRGAAALLGLGITWLVLTVFTIPALLSTENPVAVAVTSAVLISFVVLYVAHGVNARTTIALIGTLASLLCTAALALAFVSLTNLTGLASEELAFIRSQGADIDARGLLLAGIIIGTLGVLTDITVTQAAIVWEVHAADATQGVRGLYSSGMRAGRDHIASTVYTLVLAYAGVSLPLLVLFLRGTQQFGDVVTSEIVAEEVVHTLLGSIGLVASVPLTTWLAAFVVTRSANVRPPVHDDAVPDLLADI